MVRWHFLLGPQGRPEEFQFILLLSQYEGWGVCWGREANVKNNRTGLLEPLCGHWELNMGSLQENILFNR